jgi:hypothetical protein
MSDICGIQHSRLKKDERCSICWHLSIDFLYEGVRPNFTRTGGLSIDDTTPNEPLRNVKLKSIRILIKKYWSQKESNRLRTFGLLTQKGIQLCLNLLKFHR